MPRGPLAEDVEATGASTVSLGLRRGLPGPGGAISLAATIRRVAPSLLHGWMYHGNVAATIGAAASLRFPPVIWSIHHSVDDLANEKPLTRRLIKLSAALSSRVAAISYCSRVAADQHERIGFDPSKRHVVPNGTDIDRFAPTPARRGLLRGLIGVPEGRFLLGHAGRTHPMKNQTAIVDALADLLALGHDVQAVFMGSGHDESGEVYRRAVERGVADRVSALGVRRDVAELLPDLDLYVLSSAWGEAFPLAVGEAMASGVPAVVTDVGDSGWLVGDTGLVVPPRDGAALVAAIGRFLDLAPEERRSRGMAGRARVADLFSMDAYVEKHRVIYRAALGEQETRRSVA